MTTNGQPLIDSTALGNVIANALQPAFEAIAAAQATPGAAPTADQVGSAEEPTERFRNVRREANERRGNVTTIPNWKRSTLKPVDFDKYRNKATEGLDTKFSIMQVAGCLSDGVELLKENLVATQVIKLVKEHCTKYGMADVFQIVKPTAGNTIDDGATKNLFDNYSTVTKEEILTSTEFYRSYGQDWDLDNLATDRQLGPKYLWQFKFSIFEDLSRNQQIIKTNIGQSNGQTDVLVENIYILWSFKEEPKRLDQSNPISEEF